MKKIKSFKIKLLNFDFDDDLGILAVTENYENFKDIREILKKNINFDFFMAENIRDAINIVSQNHIDLIFSSQFLPDGNGVDLLRMIERKSIDIPVMVLGSDNEEMMASRMIQNGAIDYLDKGGINDHALLKSIHNGLEKAKLRMEIKKAQNQMEKISSRDELTGLYNKRYLIEALKIEFHRAKRYQTNLFLFFMRIGNMKQIKDLMGNAAGKMIVLELGKMLKKYFRMSDLLCRYSDDSFIIVLLNTDRKNVEPRIECFRKMVEKHTFTYKVQDLHIHLHIGVMDYRYYKEESPQEFIAMAEENLRKI